MRVKDSGRMSDSPSTPEHQRLAESDNRKAHWKRWGPYLSERAWGTVREDYSPYGTAWEFFSHDARALAPYRWNEDGIAGICDRHQKICFCPRPVERPRPHPQRAPLRRSPATRAITARTSRSTTIYLDCTPTHSYMKYLYKYPQARVSLRVAASEENQPRRAIASRSSS